MPSVHRAEIQLGDQVDGPQLAENHPLVVSLPAAQQRARRAIYFARVLALFSRSGFDFPRVDFHFCLGSPGAALDLPGPGFSVGLDYMRNRLYFCLRLSRVGLDGLHCRLSQNAGRKQTGTQNGDQFFHLRFFQDNFSWTFCAGWQQQYM